MIVSLTANVRRDENRVVVTQRTTGVVRLRYSPIEPKQPRQSTAVSTRKDGTHIACRPRTLSRLLSTKSSKPSLATAGRKG